MFVTFFVTNRVECFEQKYTAFVELSTIAPSYRPDQVEKAAADETHQTESTMIVLLFIFIITTPCGCDSINYFQNQYDVYTIVRLISTSITIARIKIIL